MTTLPHKVRSSSTTDWGSAQCLVAHRRPGEVSLSGDVGNLLQSLTTGLAPFDVVRLLLTDSWSLGTPADLVLYGTIRQDDAGVVLTLNPEYCAGTERLTDSPQCFTLRTVEREGLAGRSPYNPLVRVWDKSVEAPEADVYQVLGSLMGRQLAISFLFDGSHVVRTGVLLNQRSENGGFLLKNPDFNSPSVLPGSTANSKIDIVRVSLVQHATEWQRPVSGSPDLVQDAKNVLSLFEHGAKLKLVNDRGSTFLVSFHGIDLRFPEHPIVATRAYTRSVGPLAEISPFHLREITLISPIDLAPKSGQVQVIRKIIGPD